MTQALGWELVGYGSAAAVVSAILALIVLVRLNLYREVLLAACSLLLCTFLIFSLVEIFPGLARSLHLTSIHYYSLRERYVTDEKLVFRMRPFYQLPPTIYKGDLYKPIYGVGGTDIVFQGEVDKDGFRNVGGSRNGDVVVMGDSFIEIGETDADLFTSKLARRSGLKVVNLGLAWYGPFQYLEVFNRYGIERKPKYAVLSFFEGNDLKDMREYVRWLKSGDYYHFNLSSKGLAGRYRLAMRETVQHLTGIAKAFGQTGAATESRKGTTIHPDLVELKVGHQQYTARFGYLADTQTSSELARADDIRELGKILAEFQSLCGERHIVPLLMFIPTKIHIYAEYSTAQSGANWTNVKESQIAAKDHVRNAVIGLANELHLQSIDLTPLFEASAREGKMLYYPLDTHWTPEGREIAAETVAKALNALR